MRNNQHELPVGGIIIVLLVLISATALKEAFVANSGWYQVLLVTVPLLLFAINANWGKIRDQR